MLDRWKIFKKLQVSFFNDLKVARKRFPKSLNTIHEKRALFAVFATHRAM
jgi:Icc-related predicted phosphoesterase